MLILRVLYISIRFIYYSILLSISLVKIFIISYHSLERT